MNLGQKQTQLLCVLFSSKGVILVIFFFSNFVIVLTKWLQDLSSDFVRMS